MSHVASSPSVSCWCALLVTWGLFTVLDHHSGILVLTRFLCAVLLKAPEPFLTMIGLVAILDPPRPEAIEGVAIAKRAGIVVKMITGMHW